MTLPCDKLKYWRRPGKGYGPCRNQEERIMSLALPARVETADDDNNGARRDRVEQPAIVPRRALITLVPAGIFRRRFRNRARAGSERNRQILRVYKSLL